MAGRFRFDRERKFAAPNLRQQFLASLDRTLGPAMLLGLKTIHVDRQFGRRDDVGEKRRWGHEVCVEGANKVGGGRLPARGQRAGVESAPGGPVDELDIESTAAECFGAGRSELASIVG